MMLNYEFLKLIMILSYSPFTLVSWLFEMPAMSELYMGNLETISQSTVGKSSSLLRIHNNGFEHLKVRNHDMEQLKSFDSEKAKVNFKCARDERREIVVTTTSEQ